MGKVNIPPRSDTAFWRFRSLSGWGYVWLFAGMLGYATSGYTLFIQYPPIVHKLFVGESPWVMPAIVWVAMVLFGSILSVRKLRYITDPQTRMRLRLSDLAITAILLALISVTPPALGLVRGLILLLVMLAYLVVYTQMLYRGRLIPLAA